MIRSTLFILAFFISFSSTFMGQSLEWASSLDGTGGWINDLYMTSAPNGDVIITGAYSGTSDFDPGPDTLFLPDAPGYNGFIARYDTLGNLVWAKNVANAPIRQLAVDSQGNIYLTGNFQYLVDFDPGPETHFISANASRDIFILKLDNEGQFVWVKHFGYVDINEGYCIGVDEEQNVYASGIYRGSIDLDPGPDTLLYTATNDFDAFILKLNINGDLVWGKGMGWYSTSAASSMEILPDGTMFLAGSFYDSIHFEISDSTLTLFAPAYTNANSFIAKANPDGEFIWAKQLGLTSSTVSKDLIIDPEGNVLSTGVFWGIPDFDPGPDSYFMSAESSSGTYVSKLDANGDFIWASRFVGSQVVNPKGMAVDSEGAVYITGIFGQTADFNPDGSSYFIDAANYSFDAYAAKLNANGDFAWARSLSSPQSAIGEDVAVLPSGKVVLFGKYQGQTNVAPSPETYFLNTNQEFGTNVYLVCWDQICRATLTGKSFYDLNGSLTQDENEPGFSNAIYSSTFTLGLFHGASNGTFYICAPPNDSVEIALINTPTYYEAYPANYTGYVIEGDYITNLDFALVPIDESIFDLEIDLWSVLPDIAGFSSTYNLSYRNLGVMCVDNASIKIVLDENLTLQSVIGATYSTNNDTIIITINALCPFVNGEIQLEVQLDAGANLGAQLTSQAFIYPVSGDAFESNNYSTRHSIIVGAYDPNDKAVNETTIYANFLDEERYLEYLIRFQNTGTYYAQNVWVDDLLSPLLDQASFQLLHASHAVEVVFQDNLVKFVFDNIMLPDSTSNEPESHGFVRFKIKPKNTIVIGETIENTAAIYFDFNEPIITNTTQTIYAFEVGISESTPTTIRLFPNPSREFLIVYWGDLQPQSCQITDVSGRVVKTFNVAGISESLQINVNNLPSGLYFLNLNTIDNRYILRWVKT
jgi:hypothetical protein